MAPATATGIPDPPTGRTIPNMDLTDRQSILVHRVGEGTLPVRLNIKYKDGS